MQNKVILFIENKKRLSKKQYFIFVNLSEKKNNIILGMLFIILFKPLFEQSPFSN